MAIFAAIRAIGYPVAFEARAEDLDTRGFTSITRYSRVSGWTANWMLHPPSIFSARMILIAAVLRVWWSTSLRVCAGATTIDSPVWRPIGSTFSIEQIVM